LKRKMSLAEEMNWRIAVAEDDGGEKIIALDFDGVIHNYTEWTGAMPTGDPVPGALETVWWLKQAGYELFILSARVDHPMGKACIEEWMHDHGFPQLRVTLEKAHADLYVDDRGFRFTGPDSWRALREFLTANPKPGRWGKSE
jgi:hypothetical protein